MSDQGWLWARGFEGGGPHVSLYRRLAHWLMKEPELEEERLTANGRGMVLEVQRQTMSDNPGPAQIITPSGKAMTMQLGASQPGIFTGSSEVQEIGLYQVANGDLTTLAHVGPVNAPEFQEVVSTRNRAETANRCFRWQRTPAGVGWPDWPKLQLAEYRACAGFGECLWH